MGARSRSKRRRGASSADLISGLCDDVLLRILELLPDARDAVRTGALSRRWRRLWTRLSSLTFDSSSSRRRKFLESASSHKRFVDFVNNALAQRAMADDADLEHLAISLAIMSPPTLGEQATNRLVRRSAEAAQGWIRHATQSTARSFVLKLRLLMNWYRGRSGNVMQSVINLNDLPSPAKLESMQLDLGLGGVRLRLPAAAVFASLVDLSLGNIELVAGSGHLLARLVSSACCPSLQKLQLRKLRLPELNKLLIEAGALLELSIASVPIEGPETLKLKTPSLRILHIEDYAILETLGISAPKLEELTFLPDQFYRIQVDGELPCVESLKVELKSHGYEDDDDDINYGGICLLRSCTSLTCLEVSLEVTPEEDRFTDMISGRIPHLPHIISLTVHSDLSDLHSFGVGLAEILKQCSHLKYLHVHYIYMDGHNHYLCNHPNQWKPHQIYLANIQEVRFTGLAGTDCESSFIQGVLAHATQLQKVVLSLAPGFRHMIDRSTFIPCGGGTWVCQDPPLSYEWKSDPIHK